MFSLFLIVIFKNNEFLKTPYINFFVELGPNNSFLEFLLLWIMKMYDEMRLKRETTLILLASGDSIRFSQEDLPKKQWLKIGENPLWKHLINVFKGFGFEKIFVSVTQKEVNYAKNFFPFILEGGKTRTESILKSLEFVDSPYVLIHDVARFHPIESVVNKLFSEALKDPSLSCIVPRIEIADTLYHRDGFYPNREEFFAIQTPQLSKTEDLKEALSKGDFSDESSALKLNHKKIAFVQGSALMHKITHSCDLIYLKSSIVLPCEEYQLSGNGIDIHAFEEGKKMILGGVEIASDVGFRAHSDGDVALHSIIDAILGAIGAGDIGEWFPDYDLRYKNADSKNLLKEVVSFARNVGYKLNQLDLTIIAQIPKILPYKNQIKDSLAELLYLPHHRINIKATTGENLGFIGRKEGVCVLSYVCMKSIKWWEMV